MSDRKRHWESVYERCSPREASWHQTEPTLSLDLIERTGVPKGAAVIDVGGGASLLVDCLLDRGYSDLTVLDLSGTALAHARGRLGSREENVEWLEQDVTTFTAFRHFQVWHDRAVFHFLTDPADRERYVEALHRALVPQGHVIMAAFAIGGPTRCSDLDVVQYDACKMQSELGPEFRLVEEHAEAHVTPAGRTQKFNFFRLTRAG